MKSDLDHLSWGGSLPPPDVFGVMYQSARRILDAYAAERAHLSVSADLIAFDAARGDAAIEASDAIRLIIEDRLNLARVRRDADER